MSGSIATSDPAMPKIPDVLWQQSGRPIPGLLLRAWIGLLTIPLAWLLVDITGSPAAWGLMVFGLAAFFVTPMVAQSLVFDRFTRRTQALESTDKKAAHTLLEDMRASTTVRLFAPHGWIRVQEGAIQLMIGDGRAAALAYAEAERVSTHPGNKAELISAQAHALVLAGDRKQARPLLAKLAKLDALRDYDHLNFGIVLLSEAGHNSDALTHFEQAREGLGEHPRVLAGLVLANQRCGNTDAAVDLFTGAEEAVDDARDEVAGELLKRARKALRPVLKTHKKRARKEEPRTREAADGESSKDKQKPKQKPKGKKARKQARREARREARRLAKLTGSTPDPAAQHGDPDVEVSVSVSAETEADDSPTETSTPETPSHDSDETSSRGSDDSSTETEADDSPTETSTPETPSHDSDETSSRDSDDSSTDSSSHDSDDSSTHDSDEILGADSSEILSADSSEILSADSSEILSADSSEILSADSSEILSAETSRFDSDAPEDPKPPRELSESHSLANLAREALAAQPSPKIDDTDPASASGLRPIVPSVDNQASSSSLFALPDFGSVPKFTPPSTTRRPVLPQRKSDPKPSSGPTPPTVAPPSISAPKVSAPKVAPLEVPGLEAPAASAPPSPSPNTIDDGWGDLDGLGSDD